MGRFQFSLRYLVIAAAIIPPLIYIGVLAAPSVAKHYFPSDGSLQQAKVGATGMWFDASLNRDAVNRNRLHLAAWCGAAGAGIASIAAARSWVRKKRRAAKLLDGPPHFVTKLRH